MAQATGRSGLATPDEAIAEIRAGRFLIVLDSEGRESEGCLVQAATYVSADSIKFVARHGCGQICLAMTAERLDELGIPPILDRPAAAERYGIAFTVSVEAKGAVSTGILSYDRAHTVRRLIDRRTRREDLTIPGHIIPLRAREGGVLVRAGRTEAAVDLVRLADLYPAGLLCEVRKDDGTRARLPDLTKLARSYDLRIVTVKDLIAYRLERESLVERVAEARLPTRYGDFRLLSYHTAFDPAEHIALVMGNVSDGRPVLVRVHDQCVTGDAFGSLRCDCGGQAELALERIAQEGRGIFLYMRQEGRGIGLHNKIRAYALQDQGMDTVEANEALGFPADKRDYGIGMQILVDLGVQKLRLMTNNPAKRAGLEGYGLEVVERVPTLVAPNPHNLRYLQTKVQKMGHELPAFAAIGGPAGQAHGRQALEELAKTGSD